MAKNVEDIFEELSIESKYRVIKDYIARAVKNVTSQKDWKWKRRSEVCKDSKLMDLIERRRKLAYRVKMAAVTGSKEEYIKILKEYKRVRDRIAYRRLRLENEGRIRKSLEAGGKGSRNFWSYLKNE